MTLYELVLALLLCLLQSGQKLIQSLRLLKHSSTCDQHNVLLWKFLMTMLPNGSRLSSAVCTLTGVSTTASMHLSLLLHAFINLLIQ